MMPVKLSKKIGVIVTVLLLVTVCLSVFPGSACASEESAEESYIWDKYGLFVHYAYGDAYAVTKNPDGTVPANLNELADNFNAEAFADDVESFGVEYVIFTAWHCSMNVLYPSTRMANWRTGVHASNRDVIQDLIDALEPTGIKLILYTHPADGMDFSAADQTSTGWNDPTNSYQTWNNFINDIYDEMCARYGDQLDGLWFDSGFPAQVDRARLRNTVLAYNPDMLLIANGAANECCDYGCKEINFPPDLWFNEYTPMADPNDIDTWWGYNRQVAIPTTNTYTWWANGGSQKYSAEDMYKYTVLQAATNTQGGGIVWAASPYPGGTWEANVKETFQALNGYIDPVSESIKNVKASTSFVTAEGTSISELSWGGVATSSPDGRYEYIHVLDPPGTNTLDLPVPADDSEFYTGTLLENGHAVSVIQNSSGVHITLLGSDTWDDLDAAIRLNALRGDTINVAYQKTTIANSGDGSKAVDGSAAQADGWYGAAGPQSLVVDLGQKYPVSQFVIKHESSWGGNAGYNTEDYKIQCADSLNGPWTDIVTVDGNTDGVTVHEVTGINKRYFRLYITDPSNNGDPASRIYEFEIRVPAKNVALGKTVTTNSGNGSKAVDGSTAQPDGWYDASSPQWLVIDLGKTETVNKFVLYHNSSWGGNPGYNTKDFKIQYADSVNGPWTDLVTVVGNTAGRTEYTIQPLEKRYFRLYITDPSNNGDPASRIYEFEIYAAKTNIALDAATTTNSGDGSKAVDGSTAQPDGWYDGVLPQWLVVDLGETKIVSEFIVYHNSSWGGDAGYNTEDYTIQVSDSSNGPWTDVVTVEGNTAGVTRHEITPISCRYVRLYITDPSNNGDAASRIYEIEIF